MRKVSLISLFYRQSRLRFSLPRVSQPVNRAKIQTWAWDPETQLLTTLPYRPQWIPSAWHIVGTEGHGDHSRLIAS